VNATPYVTFFHAPHSRSGATRALLEELGVDYDMHVLNLKTGTQRGSDYLAINPMGKVPAIRHGDALVTEQPAVMMYLADLYPDRGLAPPPGDPLRGPYLRWMVFYGSCVEPAVMDHSAKREAMPKMQSGYGDFDSVIGVLADQLETGPWLLGERFTAADVLYGAALRWFLQWELVPDLPVFRAYVERFTARPAIQRADQQDAALAASQEG
jgi:glutathione S-transferase